MATDKYEAVDYWFEATTIFITAIIIVVLAIEFTGAAEAIINYIEYAN